MRTVEELQSEHLARNRDVPEGRMRITDEVEIALCDESRYGAEFFCWRSPQMVDEMRAFIREAKGKQRFMDVGALHGIFSLVFLAVSPDGWAMAYEPHPNACEMLRANARHRAIGVCERALSDKIGELKMHDEFGCHLVADVNGPISVVTIHGLDECCAFRPDLLKIDIEGHEHVLLPHLLPYLQEQRPTVLLEVHPKMIARSGGDIGNLCAAIRSLGCQIIDTADDQLKSADWIADLQEDARIILKF